MLETTKAAVATVSFPRWWRSTSWRRASAPDVVESARAEVLETLRDVFNIERVLPEGAPCPEREECEALVRRILEELKAEAGPSYMEILRYFLLEELDRCWKEQLRAMDALRDGIGLRGYGQTDPKQAYQREGFAMFQKMLFRIREGVFRALCRVHVRIVSPEVSPEEAQTRDEAMAEAEQSLVAEDFRHREDTTEGLRYSGGGRGTARDARKAAAGQGRAPHRPQRSLPLRQRQEIQEVLRPGQISPPFTKKQTRKKAGGDSGLFAAAVRVGKKARK